MITYINPDAIEDQSIDWSKLKNVPEFPSDGGSDGSMSPMVNVTYAELKELRDHAELVPGQQYRITDYVTTTAQTDTISANHQFDIIVTADSENTLNEVARATQHEGDTYFTDSDLNAWEIWYCLDNDINRFSWANISTTDEEIAIKESVVALETTIVQSSFTDPSTSLVSGVGETFTFDKSIAYITHYNNTYTIDQLIETNIALSTVGPSITAKVSGSNNTQLTITSAASLSKTYFTAYPIEVYTSEPKESYILYAGKGVIYRMIDEWNNDLPYDFKNIQFKRYILNADDAFATDVANGGELEIVKAKLREMSHKIHTNFWYYGEYISDVYPEANPDARYVPFGDMDYNNEGPQVLCKIGDNNFGWFYTFHNENEDASLLRPNTEEGAGVYDNIIKDNYFVFNVEEGTGSYYPTKINAQSLNNIVFVGNSCYSNSFGNSCYSNSFGNSSQSNELKTYYRYITFGEGVQFVTLQNEIKGDYDNQVQNYRVANGTHGEDGNPLVVDVIRSMGCETFIGMDSNDELKVFCLADLLNNL